MSKVTKREEIETSHMEPSATADNVWYEIDHKQHAWRCDGCGLVWNRRHLAQACEERKHITSFEQPYGWVQNQSTGKWSPSYTITRSALRREGKLPQHSVIASVPTIKRSRIVSKMGSGAQRLRNRSVLMRAG